MPSSLLGSPSGHHNLVSSNSPERVLALLHVGCKGQPDDTNNEYGQTDPHQDGSPLAEETNESSVISVPTAPIVVSEEGMRSLLRFEILAIQGLG